MTPTDIGQNLYEACGYDNLTTLKSIEAILDVMIMPLEKQQEKLEMARALILRAIEAS